MTISHALIVTLMGFTMLYGMNFSRQQARRNYPAGGHEPAGGQAPQYDSGNVPRRRLASNLNSSSARNRLNDRVSGLLALLALVSLSIAIASRYVAGS